MATLKRSFVLSKQNHNFNKNPSTTGVQHNGDESKTAITEDDDNIWDLCRELEELGGGIQTRLERISYLRLLKMPATMADRDPTLPPYLVLEEAPEDDNMDTEIS